MNLHRHSRRTYEHFTTLSAFAAAIIFVALRSPPVHAQGTAFTYQGQLKNAGTPVNGSADFTFKLFDAAAAGAQQGSTLTQNGLVVTNGLFTTQLDFGVNPFTANAARWLEISVNAQPLTPRQALTPTPFALNTRGISVDATGKVGVGTTAPTEPFTVRTPTSDYGFSHTDGTTTLSSFIGGPTVGGWLGTKSNHPLYFYTNDSLSRMTITTGGNVGIGTTAPNHRLSLIGGPIWTSSGWTGAVEIGNASAIA